MALTKTLVNTGEKTITESQAVSRLKQGDLAGLEFLVRQYQVKAVHAAILIVHDRALAEEIVQNGFLNAAQKIHQFDDRRPFGPWFLRSIINSALQEAYRQKRMVSLDRVEDAGTESVAEWLVDPGLCPEDIVENEELYQAVWKALEQLNPRQRAVIVMRYFQDFSESEITQAFDRPKTTIKWWLYTARQRLRKILWKEYFINLDEKDVMDHE